MSATTIVTADEILAHAPKIKKLQTLHRKKEFTCEVKGDSLVYTPAKQDKRRRHDRAKLEEVCKAFSESYSWHPSDYRDQTYNASYTLALIADYLGTSKTER